jgi:cobalt/nickel transport system permease protein
MHLPDGFLNRPVVLTTAALGTAGLALALRRAKRLPPSRVPLLGLSAAFVFAAQMVNFPVAGGTSGHLMGSVLVAALLGPAAAVVVMSAVLILQCLMFADGGITALGANILNMAVIGGAGGGALYHLVRRLAPSVPFQIGAAGVVAWGATVVASLACAAELAASGTVGWRVGLAAMGGVHMLIGIGEGLITMLVLAAVAKARPDLLVPVETHGFEPIMPDSPPVPARSAVPAAPRSLRPMIVLGLIISVAVAMFLAPHASSLPDGLEKTAEALGFAQRQAASPVIPAPLTDYTVPGIGSEMWATALAGVMGTAAMFLLGLLIAKLARLQRRTRAYV